MHDILKLSAVLALLAAVGCTDSNSPSPIDPTTPTTPTLPAATAITPATTVLQIGQTQLYAVTPTPTNVLAWTSSNESVLTIDADGMATGLANGVATITGSSEGATSATLAVQVVPVYAGSWAGTFNVLACTDLAGFASAGYCAQSLGVTETWTLTLNQSGLVVGGTMTKTEGGDVLSGTIAGVIGGNGDIITMTGTLSGFARGANLLLTPIAFNGIASGGSITARWGANVTSPQILGFATIQWLLAGTSQ
jgi:hypothetical protein